MQWCISDIHGSYYTLVDLLAKIRAYDSSAKFVFVGDYVDRGNFNYEVVELVRTMQEEGHVCLRGNHDDVIDWIVNDKQCLGRMSEYVVGTPSIYNVIPWWMSNGLSETLLSYRVRTHRTQSVNDNRVCAEVYEEFCTRMPKQHKDFFRGLELYWENDTHFADHGYYNPQKPLPRNIKWTSGEYNSETLWGRFANDQLARPTQWDKIGVFGHTPVSYYGAISPIKADKIRLIDTCSFKSDGYMCGYCCETDDWMLQAVDSRDVA